MSAATSVAARPAIGMPGRLAEPIPTSRPAARYRRRWSWSPRITSIARVVGVRLPTLAARTISWSTRIFGRSCFLTGTASTANAWFLFEIQKLNNGAQPSESILCRASYTAISTASSTPTGFSTDPSQSDYVPGRITPTTRTTGISFTPTATSMSHQAAPAPEHRLLPDASLSTTRSAASNTTSR